VPWNRKSEGSCTPRDVNELHNGDEFERDLCESLSPRWMNALCLEIMTHGRMDRSLRQLSTPRISTSALPPFLHYRAWPTGGGTADGAVRPGSGLALRSNLTTVVSVFQ
jgi:hypothetical protein